MMSAFALSGGAVCARTSVASRTGATAAAPNAAPACSTRRREGKSRRDAVRSECGMAQCFAQSHATHIAAPCTAIHPNVAKTAARVTILQDQHDVRKAAGAETPDVASLIRATLAWPSASAREQQVARMSKATCGTSSNPGCRFAHPGYACLTVGVRA